MAQSAQPLRNSPTWQKAAEFSREICYAFPIAKWSYIFSIPLSTRNWWLFVGKVIEADVPVSEGDTISLYDIIKAMVRVPSMEYYWRRGDAFSHSKCSLWNTADGNFAFVGRR